jgi:hypothetical protein
MTEQQRSERITELIDTRDKSLLAVLTDEQREQFESLKGAKIEVDLNKLPGFGG